MKKPALAGCAAVLALLLAACAAGQGTAKVPAPALASEAAPGGTVVQSPSAKGSGGEVVSAKPLGQHWYGFRFELGGQVLELPVNAATRRQLGWKLQGEPGFTLQSGQAADVVFATPGGEVQARLANITETPAKAEECPMAGVLLTTPDVRLPGGIAVGSTVDEVLAAYGTPDEGAPKQDGTLAYTVNRGAYLRIACTSSRASGIELVRYEAPARPLRNELPPEVLAYKTPDELGGDVWSYNIRYGGGLYSLPAPVDAFAANGWVLADDGVVPPGGFMRGVTLSLGNVRLRTCLYNPSDTEQPLAACFVGMVESSATSAPLPLELPGGVTDTTGYDEAVALLGPPHEVYTTINTVSLTWYGPGGYVVLRYIPEDLRPFAAEVWRTPG